jgi:hypothetical protein
VYDVDMIITTRSATNNVVHAQSNIHSKKKRKTWTATEAKHHRLTSC